MEGTMLLDFKVEEGTMSQGIQVALGAGKFKGTAPSLKPLESH